MGKKAFLYISGSLVFAFTLFLIFAEISVRMFTSSSSTPEMYNTGLIFAAVLTMIVLVCLWGSIIYAKLTLSGKSNDDKKVSRNDNQKKDIKYSLRSEKQKVK